jgi:hypothetical protein
MKAPFFTTMLLLMLTASLYGQSGSINNTIGTSGLFTIKDGSTTFLSLSQSTGYLSLNNSLILAATTGSTLGVIFKGANRFIHDYQASGTVGYNTFMGVNSGNFTMTGSAGLASYNTSVGHSSLALLTNGHANSAFGWSSLSSNTTGYQNSAVGYASLYSNTTGIRNSAFGFQSLYNSGDSNNTALGYRAGPNLSGGSNNTFIGYEAGKSLVVGSNNIIIGYNAEASPTASSSNQITLGDYNISSLRCNVTTITALSDARDKKNIRDLLLGLDFLMSVKPRLFNWDRREWYEGGKADGSKTQENPTAGFIAQELDEAQMKAEAEWLKLVLKSNPERLEATPGNLLPIMVKAIQELKAQNDALRNELVAMRASIAEQVKKEVRTVLLKAVQSDDKQTRVSLNETKN